MIGERLAFEIFEHEEVRVSLVPDVVERADVWMVQGCDRPRLALEALAQRGVTADMCREDLDGDRAIEPGVAGSIDFAQPVDENAANYSNRVSLSCGSVTSRPLGISHNVSWPSARISQTGCVSLVITSTFFATITRLMSIEPFTS